MVGVRHKAVFLDRDGVINRAIIRDGKPYAPRELSEFEVLPDVERACEALVGAGFLLFVVTNQPDIGNGLVSVDIVEKMHQKLLTLLPITKIYTCPHKQGDGCECRKPKSGMLLAAQQEFLLDMAESFMIGDRYSDICAGITAGCKSVFIDNHYFETPDFYVTMRTQNLWQASACILERQLL